MKLVLLLVVLIAVLTANCRDTTDHKPKPAFVVGEQAFPQVDLDHEFTGNGQEGTEDTDNALVYNQQNKNVKGSQGIKLRGKNSKKILTKLVDNLASLDYKLTQATLKLKADLEYIREEQNNITNTDRDIKMDLKMLKENQNNITDSNKDLKMDLQFIKKNQNNITDSNINLSKQLQSIENHQVNITDTNQDLNDKIESVMKNINDSNSSLTNTNSVILSKLKYISVKRGGWVSTGCSGTDVFRVRQQCFKMYRDTRRTWVDAQTKCNSGYMILAEPTDENAPLLRKYVVDRYSSAESWLGAKGDGSKFVWQSSGKTLLKDDELWDGGRGSSSYMTTSYCLELDAYSGGWSSAPGRPYDANSCTSKLYALCEVL